MANTHEAEADLRAILAEEETRLVANLNQLDAQAVLIEHSRALDTFYLARFAGAERTSSSDDLTYLYSSGWQKVSSLLLPLVHSGTLDSGIPLIRSTPDSHAWAHSSLRYCGAIVYAEQLLNYSRYGLAALERVEESQYYFVLNNSISGVEQREALESVWIRKLYVDWQTAVWSEMAEERPRIRELMAGMTAPWREHFIAYETSPEIDEHFSKLGILRSQLSLGWDSFPLDSEFGGIPFRLFRDVTAEMTAWILKHIGFCNVLHESNQQLYYPNLLAIFHDASDVVRSMSAAVEAPEDRVRIALDCLTLVGAAGNRHSGSSALAPLFAIGSHHLMRSYAGCIAGSPFFFMLRELQHRFPLDWDRALAHREIIFRRELYAFFADDRFFRVTRPVVIRHEGKVVTDIDAVIFDKRAGTLALFQLKWQQPFGGSMRERESRKRNFLSESIRWVEKVGARAASKDDGSLAQLIGLNNGETIHRVRLFVIGRYFSRFSEEELDPRAAWAAWPTVCRLIASKCGVDDPLTDLFARLQAEDVLEAPPPALVPETFKLSQATIHVRHGA